MTFNNSLPYILILGITSGQLVKLPILGSTGGITILDLTIALLVLLGIIRLKLKLSIPPMPLVFAFLFTITGGISLFFTPISLTPTEYMLSAVYLARFLLYLLLGLILLSNGLPEISQNTVKIFLYSGIILAILGILQLIFVPNLGFLEYQRWDPHYFRIVSTFLDPNFLGGYMVLSLLLLYAFPYSTKITQLFNFLLFFSLLTTFSRGAFLVFIGGFLTLSFLQRSWKTAIIITIAAIMFAASFTLYRIAIANPRNIDREQSAQYRITSWQQGLLIWQESPLFGIGYNAYRFALREYNIADQQMITSRGATSNDSSIVHILSTTGIIGSILYLLFLGSVLYKAFINQTKWGIITLASFIGLFMQSFFSNTFFYPIFMLWIIVCTIKVLKPDAEERNL